MPKALAIMINTPSSMESRASRTVRHLQHRESPSLEGILQVKKGVSDQEGFVELDLAGQGSDDLSRG
jgi:hypothetical protein